MRYGTYFNVLGNPWSVSMIDFTSSKVFPWQIYRSYRTCFLPCHRLRSFGVSADLTPDERSSARGADIVVCKQLQEQGNW